MNRVLGALLLLGLLLVLGGPACAQTQAQLPPGMLAWRATVSMAARWLGVIFDPCLRRGYAPG